jgi:hypothetical protein
MASVFMNDGAKVFEDDEPLLEPERHRDIKELLESMGDASEEYDWCRECAEFWPGDGGEDKIMDFGLPLTIVGLGDGDAVREKGLLRLGPALEAILQFVVFGESRGL